MNIDSPSDSPWFPLFLLTAPLGEKPKWSKEKAHKSTCFVQCYYSNLRSMVFQCLNPHLGWFFDYPQTVNHQGPLNNGDCLSTTDRPDVGFASPSNQLAIRRMEPSSFRITGPRWSILTGTSVATKPPKAEREGRGLRRGTRCQPVTHEIIGKMMGKWWWKKVDRLG